MSTKGSTRRDVLIQAGLGLAGGLAAHRPLPALALPRDAEYVLRQLVGDGPTVPGRLVLGLPEHSDTGTVVPITIGVSDVAGEADVPLELHVVGDGNPRPNILSVVFPPQCAKPELSTRIRLETGQTVIAVAKMRDGSIWRRERPITVNFGACAEVGSGSDEEARDFQPVSRVSVPKTAKRGEIVPIRAVISHPMETGLRLNSFNTFVPRRIIEEFVCRFGGREVIRLRLHPAVSTNPYLAFFDRVETSGTFEFAWHDTNGSVFTNRAAIEVD